MARTIVTFTLGMIAACIMLDMAGAIVIPCDTDANCEMLNGPEMLQDYSRTIDYAGRVFKF